MPHNRGNSGNKDKQKQTSEVLNESRETLYGTDRPNDPLSNSMFFQFMTRLDDRLKTIETNVTKSVGESQGLVTIQVNILSMYKHIQGRTSFFTPARFKSCLFFKFLLIYSKPCLVQLPRPYSFQKIS